MVTYNHEKYIADAIKSILHQSFDDWELIIINDGSTDGTRERIRAFDDPRIVCVDQENQGPSVAGNRAISAARGKYMALMSGDDVCHPDRLQKQIREYTSGSTRRVLFGGEEFIDEEGLPTESPHYASSLFQPSQLSRGQTLRRFFTDGNFLNGVTVFTERDSFLEAGAYDISLFQLQDYEMWIRMVKKFDLSLSPDTYVYYRIRDGGENLSSPESDRVLRTCNENYLIMRKFFDNAPLALFHEAFGDLLIRRECESDLERRCEEAFLLLRARQPLTKLIGIEMLQQLLADGQGRNVLSENYNFSTLSFTRILKTLDEMNLFGEPESILYVDTGDGWKEEHSIRKPTHRHDRNFQMTFDLSRFPQVCGLRWRVLNGCWCKVRLKAVWYSDAGRGLRRLDLDTVQSNGTLLEEGTTKFETPDPQFILPIEGPIGRLTVQGEWDSINSGQVIMQLTRRVHELQLERHELQLERHELQLERHELQLEREAAEQKPRERVQKRWFELAKSAVRFRDPKAK